MTEPLRTEGERLAKRVMAVHGCSRSEAERLIELGHVQVNGVAVHDPARRVHNETVHITTTEIPEPLPFVNLLWHKPAGVALLADQALAGLVPPEGELLAWHTKQLRCVSPLSAQASGLAVFVQDPRLLRQFHDAASLQEHEWMLDVPGVVRPEQLQTLQETAHTLATRGRTMPLGFKLSISSQSTERTRLRLAIKGYAQEQLARWLQAAGVHPTALHRLRVGRVALGALAVGGWRIVGAYERL